MAQEPTAASSFEVGLSRRTGTAKSGIWISAEEVRTLPTSGVAWSSLKAAADDALGVAEISDRASSHDVRTLAAAYVHVRTGGEPYRTKVNDAIAAAIGTERGGGSLALSRNVVSYVIAADLIGLKGGIDRRFRAWLRRGLDQVMSDGTTYRRVHATRPNNRGVLAGAARAAVASYLGDTAELHRTAEVFKGWLGDRSSWDRFRFGDLTWQCDPEHPVPVNPVGCRKDGHSIDGVLPDDQRRMRSFRWPPPRANYVYEALQGAIVQAEILDRAGYPAWEWEHRALLRAFRWLHDVASYPAQGDDEWQTWLVNKRYGTNFPTVLPARYGKNMGWTDWSHAP